MTDVVPDEKRRHVLKLFVSGATPRSVRAIANLGRILERHLAGGYDLEVIDLYLHPEAAREHQVVAAPTLVKLAPDPVRRIIGDLSDVERVLSGLGVEPRTEPGDDAIRG